MINVTKAYLPPFEEYEKYLKQVWESAWLTNNGPLVVELEEKLRKYLAVNNLWFCNNGTVVLQMALKALNITGEVITTPYSYVATLNSILWENCTPVFVDINSVDFNIDVTLLEAAITPRTQAIMAVHVYGNPCAVEAIEKIAEKHKLHVIYDAAHAFGTEYNGKQLLSYGDVSTCSFHATKIFHTIEGGAIICKDNDLAQKLLLYRSFGHQGDKYYSIGINAKNSEFHAAMGLCNIARIGYLIEERKRISEVYDDAILSLPITRPKALPGTKYNYSYYPVVFNTEEDMLRVKSRLEENSIFCRRYFYPSLNNVPQATYAPCPVSENISSRVLTLPLYVGLTEAEQALIISVIKKAL